jgi:o-succinylbenzoate synthase
MSVIHGWKSWIISRSPSSMLKTTYGQPQNKKKHVIVSIMDNDGCVGWGEATPLPEFNGETAESIKLMADTVLLPAVKGLHTENLSEAIAAMDAAVFGNYSAKAAVDTALHDLIAKELKIPEYVLFGGSLRNEIVINRHIGICSIGESQKLAEQYIKQGYRSIKVKVGISPKEDVQRIKAIRSAVGDAAAIKIDANQGYSLHDAYKVLSSLEDQNIQFCEQPLPAWNLNDLAKLRSGSTIPIAVDESLSDLHSAQTIAERHCADVFIIKLIKCGGLYRARQLAAIAESCGLKCVITSTFDTQIGAAHCLHLAASLYPCSLPCDLTCYASQNEKAVTVHKIFNGALILGREPGIGVRSIIELQDEMCDIHGMPIKKENIYDGAAESTSVG